MNFRKKRWGWGLIIIVLLAFGVLVLKQGGEPRYQDRSVTQWIRTYEPVMLGQQWQTNISTANGTILMFLPTSGASGMRLPSGLGLVTNVVLVGGTATYPAKEALRSIGPAAVPYLQEALRAKDTIWKLKYLASYPKIPRALRQVLPEPPLPAKMLRERAAQAIGELHFIEAATNLVEALGDPAPEVRRQARSSLRRFQWSEDPMAPALEGFIHREQRLDVAMDVVTFFRLKTPMAVELLSRALQSQSPLQLQAARTLCYIGTNGYAAVPALLPLLDSTDQQLLEAALGALETIGPGAQAAVPELGKMLESGQPEAPYLAARALASMVDLPAARAALEQALQNENEMVRTVARRALGKRPHQN